MGIRRALGLGKAAIFFRLIMPQMWRHALPGLGNQWLVLLKDTALVSLISVNDLMLQTKSIATRTREPFTVCDRSGHLPAGDAVQPIRHQTH